MGCAASGAIRVEDEAYISQTVPMLDYATVCILATTPEYTNHYNEKRKELLADR